MCALPRAAAVFLWPAQSTYYWELADSLARGHGFVLDGEPVTFIEPLYPAFLAVLKRLTADSPVAIGLLQAAIGALGGVLLWRCAERLAGSRAAFAAALLYACYPYYVRQAGAWIEVCLATTLAIGAAWQYVRIENIKGAALCGLWLGLLILTRATFLVTLVAFVTCLVVARHFDRALALLLVALGICLPWTLRTHAIDRSTLPPRVGENLFVSTGEFSRAAGPRYDVDLLVEHSYDLIADEVARREKRIRLPDGSPIACCSSTLSPTPPRILSRPRGSRHGTSLPVRSTAASRLREVLVHTRGRHRIRRALRRPRQASMARRSGAYRGPVAAAGVWRCRCVAPAPPAARRSGTSGSGGVGRAGLHDFLSDDPSARASDVRLDVLRRGGVGGDDGKTLTKVLAPTDSSATTPPPR